MRTHPVGCWTVRYPASSRIKFSALTSRCFKATTLIHKSLLSTYQYLHILYVWVVLFIFAFPECKMMYFVRTLTVVIFLLSCLSFPESFWNHFSPKLLDGCTRITGWVKMSTSPAEVIRNLYFVSFIEDIKIFS